MGKAIGVLGDPNTGKSVLTYLLYRDFVRKGVNVFRQEGDPASPTPPWYLETVCRERADELRRQIKTGWCHTSAEWVRRSIEGLKRGFNIVLVDLGGGRPPKERVTDELKHILSTVDYVIILCQKGDEKCRIGWRKELSEKAPHVKVLFECESSLSDESYVNDKCLLGSLDRSIAHDPPEHLRRAIDRLTDKIVKLV